MGRKWPPIVVTLRDDDIAGIPVLPVMAPLQTRDLCGGMIAGCRPAGKVYKSSMAALRTFSELALS